MPEKQDMPPSDPRGEQTGDNDHASSALELSEGASHEDSVVIPREAFAEMFRPWSFRRQPRKRLAYLRSFVMDEATLRRLDKRITDRFAEAELAQPIVQISVGYADLSAEQFTDWDTCFSEALEAADARRLEASWETVGSDGSIYQLELVCVTEIPVTVAPNVGPQPEDAHIAVSATGATRDWVSGVLSGVDPIVKNTRLGKIYRPLEGFRSVIVREVGAWLIAATVWFISLQLLNELVAEPNSESSLGKILRHRTLSQQFEAYVRDIYSSHQSLLVGLFIFVIPYGLLFAVLLIARRALGYIVPRSAINIGLATKRYTDYMNVFRFVVFTIVVGVIVGVVGDTIASLV